VFIINIIFDEIIMNQEEFIQINVKDVETSPQNIDKIDFDTKGIIENDIILKEKGIKSKIKKEYDFKLKIGVTACGICLDPVNQLVKLKCKHSFCRDCLVEYFMSCCNVYRIVNIVCPQEGCKKRFPYSEIINILMINNDNNLQLKRYLKILKDFHILENGNMYFCPVRDCDSYAINSKNDLLYCHSNQHCFCKKCGQNEEAHKVKCEIEILKGKIESKVIVCDSCHYINPCLSDEKIYFECENCLKIKCFLCNRNDTSLNKHYSSTIFSLCFSMKNISKKNLLAKYKAYRFLYILICVPIIIFISSVFLLAFSSFILVGSGNFNKHSTKLSNSSHIIFTVIKALFTLLLGIALYPTLFLYSVIGFLLMMIISVPTFLKKCFSTLSDNQKEEIKEAEEEEEENSSIYNNKNKNIEKIDSLLSKL